MAYLGQRHASRQLLKNSSQLAGLILDHQRLNTPTSSSITFSCSDAFFEFMAR